MQKGDESKIFTCELFFEILAFEILNREITCIFRVFVPLATAWVQFQNRNMQE